MDVTRTQLEELIRAIHDVILIRKDISRLAASKRCHFGALSVLATLATSGDARVSHLAEALMVDVSVASRQLAQLEAHGYVGRRADPADGRAHLVFVTEAGRQELASVRADVVDHFESALHEWQGGDVATLTAQLRRLRADLGLSRLEPSPGADTAVRAEPDHPNHQQHRTGVDALS
ncbi:DNA-binding transcriptional regulator, MarR family [Actinopolymorpha cephalotaxi]|uniref:DNA-binding MarR family transcriptional regulator n=1 Tax=Actinopolymorpha cephalotaxi TaxID=504797 RepID=A0A1I2TB87_9ACTN|nr:MarR family winged helix-turn-helix transcriptional regulator [Actinopolymorpha cephalotaxi]NYH83006.1 DNA-binding MarR family transcriptional regulator [Actinopolymorpha cephalotaxi]SFG62125.1 DNA-binding transcriptional regulator, MarR family [Actinopolymorpha cephalotaxi]